MTKAQTKKAINNYLKSTYRGCKSIVINMVDDMLLMAKAIVVTEYMNAWEYTFFHDGTYTMELMTSKVADEYLRIDLNMWTKLN